MGATSFMGVEGTHHPQMAPVNRLSQNQLGFRYEEPLELFQASRTVLYSGERRAL